MRTNISAINVYLEIEEVIALSDELRSAIQKIETYGKLDTNVIMLKKLNNQLEKVIERVCVLDANTAFSMKPQY